MRLGDDWTSLDMSERPKGNRARAPCLSDSSTSPSDKKKGEAGKGQCQYSTGGVASPRALRAEMLSSTRHAPGQGRDGLAIR